MQPWGRGAGWWWCVELVLMFGVGVGCGPDGSGTTGSGGMTGTGGSSGGADAGADAAIEEEIPPPQCAWVHGYEWLTGDEFTSIDVDAAENAYVSGRGRGELDFGGGLLDPDGPFVVSFAPDGGHRYTLPLPGSDAPLLVADDEGNTYLAGTFHDEVVIAGATLAGEEAGATYGYVASLNADGQHRWSMVVAPGRVGLNRIVPRIGAGGHLYLLTSVDDRSALTIGGESFQTVDTGGDILVVTVDAANGELVGHFIVGGPDDEQPRALDVGPDGNLYLFGSFTDTASLGGDTFVADRSSKTFLASFEPDGRHRWSQALNLSATAPRPLAVGDAVYLSLGPGVTAFDHSGDELWAQEVPQPGAIAPHPMGGAYVGAHISRPSPEYDRFEVTRLDADGTNLETYTQRVVVASLGSSAHFGGMRARGDSVWMIADSDDAIPGLTGGDNSFAPGGMICRIDDLGR